MATPGRGVRECQRNASHAARGLGLPVSRTGLRLDTEYGRPTERADNGLLVVFDRLAEARLGWDIVNVRLESDDVVAELHRTGPAMPSELSTIEAAIDSPTPRWVDNYWFPDDQEAKLWAAQVRQIFAQRVGTGDLRSRQAATRPAGAAFVRNRRR